MAFNRGCVPLKSPLRRRPAPPMRAAATPRPTKVAHPATKPMVERSIDDGPVGSEQGGQTPGVASPSFKCTFSPHPRYWVGFGKFEEGEVIGPNLMTQRFEAESSAETQDCAAELNGDEAEPKK